MPLAPSLLLAAALLGWADDITIAPRRGDRLPSAWLQTIGNLDRPSERTAETLRRYELARRYRHDVDGTIAALEKAARAQPDPELVFAIAELSWIEARRLDRRRRPAALERYVDTVAYAADFLFDPELSGRTSPTDPRFLLACHLYNGGLDRLVRAAQKKGPIEPGETITLTIHGQKQVMRVELDKRSPWTADDLQELHLAADFEVTGLPGRTYQPGLGVPLIGVRRTDPKKQGSDRFLPPEVAFPLTAFLQPNSRLRDQGGDVAAPRACTLRLVDPVQLPKIEVGRAGAEKLEIPVESDLTTPLAYMWSRTDLSRYRWTGLLHPGDAAGRAGLMLLRPYEPGKIPVVMVHGLISSPLAWIPMINDLLRDPEIQQNFQFFLYLYPTGVTVPIAAAGLRDALVTVEQSFNPDGRDPAFARMVLLGHSMGGLLSHAMAVHSDNRFWELYSDRPFEEIENPSNLKGLQDLRHYMFFPALPFVRRVVFLAVPHRGSELSRRVVGRVSSSLITEPDYITDLLTQLVKANPDAFDRRQFRHLPTSIETLDPDSEILAALLAMRPGEGVAFHSIIGSLRGGGVAGSTDGVVPYRSSHLEGPNVRSEKVVRSDHGVQRDPEAIREVHRILREHLKESLAGQPRAAAGAPPLR